MLTPPFRRAPTLLFDHPVVLGAITGAAAILGLVVALTPQFLSSASSSALQRDLAGRCDSSYAGSMEPGFGGFGSHTVFPGVNEASRGEIETLIDEQPNLADPRATIEGAGLFVFPDGDVDAGFNTVLLFRSGYEDHIDLIAGGEEPGVWFDQYAADTYDLGVGDLLEYEFTTELPDGQERVIAGHLQVAGITEDHVALQSEPFWCGVDDLIGLTATGDRRPPVGLVPIEALGGYAVPSHGPDSPDEGFLRGLEYWELPVELDGLTPSIADDIAATFTRIGAVMMDDDEGVRSDLSGVNERVSAVTAALTTSVRPLALAVTVIAFGLMAAAGSYWVDRRSWELRLLSAHGIGPVALGVKAMVESLIPIAFGVALGGLLAVLVGDAVGPGGGVEPVARWAGWQACLPAGIGALLVVGAVAGARSRTLLLARRRRRSSRWWSLPLAVLLAGAAAVVRRQVGGEAVLFGENDLVGSVNPLVVLFPILAFAAVALLGAELLLWSLRRLKAVATSKPAYIGIRRLLSSPIPVVVLLAGTLIPAATLVYSAVLTRSTDASIQAKARVFIGSDVRAPVFDTGRLPADLVGSSTFVSRAERVELGGVEVDFMVVDPATFDEGAFWDPSFSDMTLPALLALLEPETVPLPAIVANASVGDGTVELDRLDVPVTGVAMAAAFPGSRVGRPLIVVGRDGFEALVRRAGISNPERDGTIDFIWVRDATADEVESALARADIGFGFTTTVPEALDLTKFQAIIWTFDFLELYAGLSGLIVVGAILLYADTRQRARNLSYALALRMGLTRGEHMISGVLEIGGIVVVGTLLGAIVASSAAGSVYGSLDPLPDTPPAMIRSATLDLVLVLLALALTVSLLAAWVAQRTADRADVADLLRHTN